MGLSGFVNCRCWKDAGLDGPIGFDEDGWLDLLDPENPVAWRWFQAGCEHQNRTTARVDLGPLSAQHQLRQTCEEIGWSLLPTLDRVLPTTNDGGIPVADVPAVLSELDVFADRVCTGTETALIDEATGEAIYRSVGSHRSVVGWAGRLHAGVDEDGFCVVRARRFLPPVVLFRARRFTQRALDGDIVEFVGDDGSTARLPLFLIGRPLPVPPERLSVVTRPQSAHQWEHWLTSMRMLGAAALATGNPIKWG